MPVRDFSAACPPEILQRFVADWEPDDLRMVVAVCTRWRQILLDAPEYWSSATLACVTSGSVNLLLLQLERARGRPCSLTICRLEHCGPETSRVLLAVAQYLPTLKKLGLTISSDIALLALEALTFPARMLTAFDLTIILSDPPSMRPTVPVDIFSGDAPQLTTLVLDNVDLPRTACPALSRVHTLNLANDHPDDEPPHPTPDIVMHFPDLRRFMVTGKVLLLPSSGVVSTTPNATWGGLTDFRIFVRRIYLERALTLPIEGIDYVQVIYPSIYTTEVLLRHLTGPVGFSAVDYSHVWPGGLNAEFFEYNGRNCMHGRVRACLELAESWEEGVTCVSKSIPGIASRIAYFVIEFAMWQAVVSQLPPLPSLAEVSVTLSGREADLSVTCPLLFCASLRCVIMRATGSSVSISTTALGRFASTAFGSLSRPLELVLENTTLIGPHDEIAKYFFTQQN
ncbi:hypothetical protein EXIGLDRAFT_727854, partial [Exidia glandulosa HHB12029]